MKRPFRRRKVVVQASGGSGIAVELKIPYDPHATDDADALVRHFKRLFRLDPDAFEELISGRLGRLLFGVLRMKGPKLTVDSLGNFDDSEEATPGPMSAEEYEEWMVEGSPLLRQVYQRLKGK